MAITKNPKRAIPASDREANDFIAGSARQASGVHERRLPTMVRIPPDLLRQIDKGAKRLGISRSAFIVSSAAEKVERMGHRGE